MQSKFLYQKLEIGKKGNCIPSKKKKIVSNTANSKSQKNRK